MKKYTSKDIHDFYEDRYKESVEEIRKLDLSIVLFEKTMDTKFFALYTSKEIPDKAITLYSYGYNTNKISEKMDRIIDYFTLLKEIRIKYGVYKPVSK